MITLSIILILAGIVSHYRIYKKSRGYNEHFNPFNGSVIEYLFWLIGITVILGWIIPLILYHLP